MTELRLLLLEAHRQLRAGHVDEAEALLRQALTVLYPKEET